MNDIKEIEEYYAQGNLVSALKKAEEVIKQNPSKDAYNLLGKILKELGEDDKAIDAFMKAGNYVEVAKIYISKGMYKEALKALSNVNDKEARLLKALAYLKLEEYEKAKEELNGLEDSSPLFYKVKGIIDYYTGDSYDALRELSIAVSLYPLDAELYYFRALTKMKLGLNAEDDLNTAMNLNPYFAEVYFSKGVLLENEGKLEEAITYYSKAINLNPEYIQAYVRRAKTYMKLGKEEEAIEDIKKVSDRK
ncbi:tetratricopeptide repeat protein [Sulfurisphaera javensis]|uniref:Tetratricopeptide repeat protein n=1 Tax=Sulfurisphaera javensis TaxID=2049879 RepID=A0AAT9GTB8_9CREN